jgi:hypothetical protein
VFRRSPSRVAGARISHTLAGLKLTLCAVVSGRSQPVLGRVGVVVGVVGVLEGRRPGPLALPPCDRSQGTLLPFFGSPACSSHTFLVIIWQSTAFTIVNLA